MQSFLDHDITGEQVSADTEAVCIWPAAASLQWVPISTVLIEDESPVHPLMVDDPMGRIDVSFDPFLSAPPLVEHFPYEDPLVVARRHATFVLKQLVHEGEYARVPLWLALDYPDLVQDILGPLRAEAGY